MVDWSTPRIVDTVEDIDAQWVTAVLAHAGIVTAVSKCTAESVGTGQMGSCFRLRLKYGEEAGPASLIVKLPAANPDSRAAGSLGYRCETSFYRKFADRISARVPRCFFSAADPSTNSFTLVLEDLSPAQQGDQIDGCTIDEALAAAINVAGLHAPTWNDPSVRDLDWLIPDLTAMPEPTAEFLRIATDQFLDRHSVEPATAPVLERFVQQFAAWAAGRPAPYSLLHNDYRPDNLLFAPPGAPDPVVAVDWQVVSVGLPLRDVALLLATGLSTEDRRRAERAIIVAYQRRLVELGVTDYDVERCWNDYRYALFQGVFITVLGAFVAQPTERGNQMFTVMADRSAAAITDLDAFSLLGS